MSQLPLFASTSEIALVDDERGRIVYTADFVPAEIARAWLAELREAAVGARISLAFRVKPARESADQAPAYGRRLYRHGTGVRSPGWRNRRWGMPRSKGDARAPMTPRRSSS